MSFAETPPTRRISERARGGAAAASAQRKISARCQPLVALCCTPLLLLDHRGVAEDHASASPGCDPLVSDSFIVLAPARSMTCKGRDCFSIQSPAPMAAASA